MNVVTFNPSMIHAVKQVLAKGLPSKSGHLSEALAACLGFRTHAALRAKLEADGFVVVHPDPKAAFSRLVEFEGPLQDRKVLPVVVQSLVYGAEYAYVRDMKEAQVLRFEDEWLDGLALGCRALYQARLRSLSTSWLLAARLARLPPHADPDLTGMTVDEGRLVFDPFHMLHRDFVSSEDALSNEIVDLVVRGADRIDAVPPNLAIVTKEAVESLERPRSLRSLRPNASFEDMMAALDASPAESFSELEAVRLVTWLGFPLADHEIPKVWRLLAFAQARLPTLAVAALREYVALRFSPVILLGRVPQEIPAMLKLTDEEAAAVMANMNTKVFMRIDDMEETRELVSGNVERRDGEHPRSDSEKVGPAEGVFHPEPERWVGREIWLSDEEVRRHMHVLTTTGRGGFERSTSVDGDRVDPADVAGQKEGDSALVHDGNVMNAIRKFMRGQQADPVPNGRAVGELVSIKAGGPGSTFARHLKQFFRKPEPEGGSMGYEVSAVDVPQDEREAQSIMGSTNTKVFMRIDDMEATMDLEVVDPSRIASDDVRTMKEGETVVVHGGHVVKSSSSVQEVPEIRPGDVRRQD